MRTGLFLLVLLTMLRTLAQGPAFYFSTVSEMTNSFPIPAVANKAIVLVTGTSGPPGGVFYWDALSEVPVSEPDIFATTQGGRWIRLIDWTGGAGGGSAVSVTGTFFPILNILEGANIDFAIAGTALTISGITSSGSGTSVSVDAGAILAAANFGDGGDINFSVAGAEVTGIVKPDAVALGTDTVGTYVATATGTANEVQVGGSGGEGASITISLPGVIDLGGKTSLEIPNAATPSTGGFGQVAGDNNAWGVGRGAIQTTDGTSTTYLIGVQTSDVPANGQVPKWNTDGTITWEDDGGGGGGGTVVTVDAGAVLTALDIGDSLGIDAVLTVTPNKVAFSLVDGDRGDISIGGGGADVMSIDAEAIPLDELSDVTLTGVASGDILFRNATLWANLAKGTDGEVLKLVSGIPSWETDLTAAGGFLPLTAGPSFSLTGDLHYEQADDIRSPMWESGTAFNAMGIRVRNGTWNVAEFQPPGSDWTVLEEFITVDPTDTVGPDDVITFNNSGFNNHVVFDTETTTFTQKVYIPNPVNSVLVSVPSGSNHTLDFAYGAMTYAVTANVNLVGSANRPIDSSKVAFTVLRLAGDTVDRTLSWHASWKRVGTSITTIPANKVVLVSAMCIGTAETGVTFGIAKEE